MQGLCPAIFFQALPWALLNGIEFLYYILNYFHNIFVCFNGLIHSIIGVPVGGTQAVIPSRILRKVLVKIPVASWNRVQIVAVLIERASLGAVHVNIALVTLAQHDTVRVRHIVPVYLDLLDLEEHELFSVFRFVLFLYLSSFSLPFSSFRISVVVMQNNSG